MATVRWLDAALIVSWFLVCRALAAAAGIAPDRGVPEILWQLLPLDLLQTRLLESLWYLHSQPPLFNALVGVLLKLPGDYITIWRVLWVLAGLGFPLTIFACLRLAGARHWVAHTIAIAICLNPTLVLYENFLFYSYPEALCVLIGLYALLAAGHQRGGWSTYAVVGSTLTLFRATFQPLWALGIVGLTAWSCAGRLRRAHWLCLAAPLIVGALLTMRNGVLFDVWTTSSWYGMNVAKLTATAMLGETPRLVQTGVVSEVFAIGPFQPVRMYPPPMVSRAADEAAMRFSGAPALAVEHKANGQPNFNHLIYRDVSRQLSIDSLAAARARPALFEETVWKGLRNYAQPASLYVFVDPQRRLVQPLENLYMTLIYPGGSLLVVQWALIATLLTSGGIALFESDRFAALRPAASYVFVTVLWVSVASNLAEYGENSRLRFTLDPLIATWCAVLPIAASRPRRAETPGV